MSRRFVQTKHPSGRGALTCRACGTPAAQCWSCYGYSCPSCALSPGRCERCQRPDRPTTSQRHVKIVAGLFETIRAKHLGEWRRRWIGADLRTLRRARRRYKSKGKTNAQTVE